MDEHRVALFDAIGLAQEILRGEPSKHDRRARLIRNAARQLDEIARLDIALLGVRADRAAIGDPVAGLELLDRRTDLDDLARALVARRERQLRRLIKAVAVTDVQIIDPDRVLAKPDLARTRLRQIDLLEHKDFGTAGLVNANCTHRSP